MTETKKSSITNSRRPLRKCIALHPFLSITFAGLGILRIACIRKCSKIAGRPKARGHATTETSFVTEPIWRAACHAQNTHSEEIIRLPANLSSSPPPPFPSAENVLLQQMESFLHLTPPKTASLSYLCLLQRRGLSRTRVGLHVQPSPYIRVVCCVSELAGYISLSYLLGFCALNYYSITCKLLSVIVRN